MATTSQQDVVQKVTQALQGAGASAVEKVSQGEVPGNVDVSRGLDTLKPGSDIDRARLSETGQTMAEQMERLVEDTKRLFLSKNREEDLQKAAVHASRAAQIARRHDLVSTAEGQEALEAARKGMYNAVNLARLVVTSAEFREELADSLGLIQQALRRGGAKTEAGKPAGETTESTTEEEDSEGEEGETYWTPRGEQAEGEQGATTAGEQALKQTERKAQQYNPLTDEQQEAFAERFFKLAQRLQAKPEYQHGVRYLLEQLRTTMEKGGIHAERMQEQLRETPEGQAFLSESGAAKDHALRLIEIWTETSLEPLFTRLNFLGEKMRDDQETRDELHKLASFVERMLTGNQFVHDKEAVKRETKDRFNRVRERLMQKYDEPVRRLSDELSYIRDSFRENEVSQVLQRDVNDLVRTILYDEQGQPTVKVELVKDLQVLLTSFMRRVQWIPVPRVAISTPDIDFAADNIVVNLRELTPSQIKIESLTKVRDKGLEKGKPLTEGTEPIELETFLRLHLTGITSDLHDVVWYYNKKSGVIQEHDRGRADVKIHGRGMSIDIDIQPALPVPTPEKPVARSLEILQATANVHKMSLRVYDSKHDFLYALFKPFIKSQLKSAIESAVSQYMRDYLQRMDEQLTVSTMGEYPATRPLEVEKKQTSTTTTSATGEPAPLRNVEEPPA